MTLLGGRWRRRRRAWPHRRDPAGVAIGNGDGEYTAAVPQPYLVFIWTPGGYVLAEREGDPPGPGSEVELDEAGGARYLVTKVAPSPLPGDERRCAYLQAV